MQRRKVGGGDVDDQVAFDPFENIQRASLTIAHPILQMDGGLVVRFRGQLLNRDLRLGESENNFD